MTTQANKKQRTDTGASVTDDKTTPATAAATGVVAVDPQVAKALASSSTDLKRKKNAKTPAQLAEEEKYRLDASMKARMGDRAFYLVFDPRLTDLQLDKYNKSKGVLLDPVTKSIIAKSSVCMECCEFVVVASASRCSGEGTTGFVGKGYITSRGAARYSIMLTPGWSELGVPCPVEVANRQTICMNKMVETQERLLGLWFDSNGETECSSHYKTCFNSVRAKKGGGMIPQIEAEAVQLLEIKDAAIKEEMRVAARAKWIATCGVNFREGKDEAGRVQQRVCFAAKKVYAVKPKVYTGKQMPPGPTLDEIESKNTLIPWVTKKMDSLGWKRNYLKYQLESVDPTSPERHLAPKVVHVPDLDMHGVPILNAQGLPVMTEIIDSAWDPLNISPEGHPITSMAKLYVTFTLSNGGSTGKPNCSCSISGDIVIVRQDRRRVQEYFATASSLTTGLYKAPARKIEGAVEEEEEVVEEQAQPAHAEFNDDVAQKMMADHLEAASPDEEGL